MRAKSTGALIAVISASLFAGSVRAEAQQQACFHKARQIHCHFADGKTVDYATEPTAEFYTIPAQMTFRTKDGALHSIIGNCETVCTP